MMDEGVDHCLAKTFETQHPYPKADQVLKRTYKHHNAIGYEVTLDKKCAVESANDYLVLKSSEH